MYRRMIPPAMLIALVLGCGGNTKTDSGSGSGGGGGDGSGGDTNKTYTVKLHEKQAGDKFEVRRSGKHKKETSGTINGQTMNKEEIETEETEFTEIIDERPAGSKKPTKMTRVYHRAEYTEKGKTKTLPYANKTVTIEKGPVGYLFRIKGGALLVGADAKKLQAEFARDQEDMEEEMLPKAPVKLNEVWKIDLKRVTKDTTDKSIDPDKSFAEGKLVRAYAQDGRQFGVIEVRIDRVASAAEGNSGTIKLAMTFDGCIDGTSSEGKGTMKALGDMTFSAGGQGNLRVKVDNTDEVTVRPVK